MARFPVHLLGETEVVEPASIMSRKYSDKGVGKPTLLRASSNH
jgi:hypothetical protein